MSRNRARLPEAEHRHIYSLSLKNETRYDGVAIRSLITACLHALNLKIAGVVRVYYSSDPSGHHGVAAIGKSARFAGMNMSLSIPRDPSRFDEVRFARLVHHEALHWRGVRHEDMTEEQRWVARRGWTPSWYSEWAAGREIALQTPDSEMLFATIAFTPAKTKTPSDARLKKLAHAEAMLKRAKRRLKLAETVEMKWQRRVCAAKRAIERADTVETKEAAS